VSESENGKNGGRRRERNSFFKRRWKKQQKTCSTRTDEEVKLEKRKANEKEKKIISQFDAQFFILKVIFRSNPQILI
jgi:hypothetical protein